jgi:hypothetical protein
MFESQQGPFWRVFDNVREHQGEIRRCAAVANITNVPTVDFNNALRNTTWPRGSKGGDQSNAQIPMVIKTYLEGEYVLCVTTNEIWWYVAATDTWKNLTPILFYDSGLGYGSETTGSTIEQNFAAAQFKTTGANDNNFQTRKIAEGMILEFDPGGVNEDTFIIENVFSENVLWVDHTPAVATAEDWRIRRTFACDWVYPIFADVFNGDLYVAGRVSGGGSPAAGAGDGPAIIKVTDVFRSGVDAFDSRYLMSRFPLHQTTGGDGTEYQYFHQLSDLREILGLDFLGDSRAVILTWEAGGAGGKILNRVRYSDHSNNEEWDPAASTSTAGYSDRTEIPGRVTALGRFGNSLTVHFPGGIVWGHPTGEQSPPLNFQPAIGCYQGCVLTRTLRQTPIGEVFLGTDHQILLFDGSKVGDVGEDMRKQIAEDWGYSQYVHAGVDWHRSEYSLFLVGSDADHASFNRKTLELIFNWRNGQWKRRWYDGGLHAVSEIQRNNPGGLWTTRLDGEALVGTPSLTAWNWSGEGEFRGGESATRMLYCLKEKLTTFESLNNTDMANSGFDDNGCNMRTDVIDGGADLAGFYKSWRYISFWLGRHILTDGLSQTIKVAVSSDQGDTWRQERTKTITGTADTPAEFVVHFYFDPFTSETIVVRIKIDEAPYLLTSLRQFAIWYQLMGQVEANFDAVGVLSGA